MAGHREVPAPGNGGPVRATSARRDRRALDFAALGPDGIVAVDGSGALVWASPVAAAILGYRDGELPDGFNILGLVHPDDLWEAADSLRTTQRAAGVSGAPVTVRVRRADGSYHVVEAVASNHLDDPDVGLVVIAFRDLAPRREIHEAFAAAERDFGAVIRHAPEVVLLLDRDGVIQYVSPSLVAASGYDVDDLVGKPPHVLIHPDDLDRVVEEVLPLWLEPGGERQISCRVLHPGGVVRHVEAKFVNLLDDPAVGRVAVYVRDVTERLEAVAALAVSERRFRGLVQHSFDLTIVYGVDGVVTYVSPAVRDSLGLDEAIVLGRNALEFVHPDDRSRAVRWLASVRRRRGSREVGELRLRHADGTYRTFEFSLRNLLDEPAIAGFVANGRDVTERTVAEAARAEVEERFASAFEEAPIGMALQDMEGRFLQVNRALCELVGYGKQELLGRTGASLTHPDDLPLQEAYRARVASGEVAHYQFEKRFVRSDGRSVWVKLSVSAVAGPDGRPHYAIAHVEDVTGRRHAEERLTHQALHDSLTGLPNRTLLLDRLGLALEQARRGGPRVALLFCDLDRFKLVNDSLGHHVGDRLLVQCAERLRHVVRAGDTVSRFGGDEFVVLCSDIHDRVEVLGVAERIAAALQDPFVIDGTEFVVSTSIGIAFSHPDVTEPVELLRDADAAMYRAKELGRSRWVVFQAEMRSSVVHRAETERALRRAVEQGELELHYQPLVRLGDRAVVGAEALVRWRHPERGLVMPGEFIALAEETGLIVPIGEWVVGEAARQLAAWRAAGVVPDDFVVAANLSVRQLDAPDFAGRVAAAVAAAGLDPSGFCFELTESALADDGGAVLRVLQALRDLGVGLAIDDFGTGYSALSHLKRFPFDTLKIDRTFVDGLGRDAEDEAIVAAVVGVARALELAVVAEGIETREQLEALRRHGVTVGQGFLIGRPVPAVELVARHFGGPLAAAAGC